MKLIFCAIAILLVIIDKSMLVSSDQYEKETDDKDFKVISIRTRRGAMALRVYYQPDNPYSCYDVRKQSKLYCTSNKFTVNVQSTNTVLAVKQIVEKAEGYPVKLQVMSFNSQILDDSRPISSYNIVDQDEVELKLSQIP